MSCSVQDFLLQEEIERERERRALCVWPALGRGPGRQRGAWGEAVLRPDLGLSLSQASGSARSARRSASEERRSPKSQSVRVGVQLRGLAGRLQSSSGHFRSVQGAFRSTRDSVPLLLRRAREREEREKERLKQREEKAGGAGLCCGTADFAAGLGRTLFKGFLCCHNGDL